MPARPTSELTEFAASSPAIPFAQSDAAPFAVLPRIAPFFSCSVQPTPSVSTPPPEVVAVLRAIVELRMSMLPWRKTPPPSSDAVLSTIVELYSFSVLVPVGDSM